MKIAQHWCNEKSEWSLATSTLGKENPQLVLVFGGTKLLRTKDKTDWLRSKYPQAALLGCSTAGEICGTRVFDDTLVATAIHFEKTRFKIVEEEINDPDKSDLVGENLAKQLKAEDLAHILVFSDGIHVNGSELVKGLRKSLPDNVSVTGGLAGDSGRFEETLVLTNHGALPKRIALLGFYGNNLDVGYGSLGGWDPFGPQRIITRSHGNILFELDGQSALSLYKTYLGDHTADLPASAFLFPLELKTEDAESGVVRTVLGINEKDQSMTFAGDMPQGAKARLMKANFDRLVDGAIKAAETCCANLATAKPELAILITCIGRKLILKQRTEEETEGAREILGDQAVMTGFYSYGEISPFSHGGRCELHNQTMTITTFSERNTA